MITAKELNNLLKDTTLDGIFEVINTIKVDEQPHPFCITGKHIKRYHLDVEAGPCGMRVNPLTKEWSNKRETKKGIIDTCGLSYKEHTYKVLILLVMKVLAEEGFPILEKSLNEDGFLTKIFKEHNIIGFDIALEKPEE